MIAAGAAGLLVVIIIVVDVEVVVEVLSARGAALPAVGADLGAAVLAQSIA
jgi:hypothetical protein